VRAVRPTKFSGVSREKPAADAASLPDFGRENCMKQVRQISLILIIAGSFLALVACGQKSNCSGITFGGSSSGGSTGTGGVSSGGNVCGGGSTGGGGGSFTAFVYFMSGFNINGAAYSGSSLAAVAGTSPALGNGTVNDMTVVSNKFLYEPFVPNGASVVSIQSFSINHTNGSLAAISSNPVATTLTAGDSITSDPAGRFLFVGNSQTGEIAVFQVDPTTGALTDSPGSPFSLFGNSVTSLTVDGTGHFLYAANSGSLAGDVTGFTIDQTTGALSLISGSPFPTGLFDVKGESSGKYLLGLGFGSNVTVVTIEAGTGALLSEANFPTVSFPDTLAVSPNGSFVYTFAVNGQNKALPVEGYQLDASGNLTAVTGSPFSTVAPLRNGKFTSDGKSLFGQNDTAGIQVLTSDPTTGALTGVVPPFVTVTTYFAPTN
jgi:6-phosphogluconolactonase (cycloisomerase 2 family)